jgi:hypothetical protein
MIISKKGTGTSNIFQKNKFTPHFSNDGETDSSRNLKFSKDDSKKFDQGLIDDEEEEKGADNQKEKNEIERHEQKDKIVDFVKNFLSKPPLGSTAPQIWATENINKFLNKAEQSEIQQLFKEIIKNNTYFVSLLGVDEIAKYWRKFSNESREFATKLPSQKLTQLKVFATVLDTIYKNISTQNEGLGLNSYLKYRMKFSYIKHAIVEIKGANAENLDLIINSSEKRISLSDKSQKVDETKNIEREQEEYIKILMDLTFHVMRNYNVARKFGYVLKDEAFDNCKNIITDTNTHAKSLKVDLLEYLSTAFFTHVFRVPEKVVLPSSLVSEPLDDPYFDASEQKNLNSFREKVKSMLEIYKKYCEFGLAGKCTSNDKKECILCPIQAIHIIKVLVQKNMIFTGNETSQDILNNYILPLAENYDRALKLISAEKPVEKEELMVKLENTLHRLCLKYSIAAAKEIARDIQQQSPFEQNANNSASNQILNKVKQKELTERNPALKSIKAQINKLCR